MYLEKIYPTCDFACRGQRLIHWATSAHLNGLCLYLVGCNAEGLYAQYMTIHMFWYRCKRNTTLYDAIGCQKVFFL